MNDYGFAYEHGKGVKKNMRWALYWYKKAAKGGNADALNNLAHIWLFGKKNNAMFKKDCYMHSLLLIKAVKWQKMRLEYVMNSG